MKVRSTLTVAILVALGSATAVSAQAKKTPSKSTTMHFVVAPTGNEARYKVREQLAGFDLPNEVVGTTRDVTGRFVVEPDGKVVRDSSRIIVKLTGLKSDKTRRDKYLQSHTLDTEKFPQVELVPVNFAGINAPIPAGTSRTFSLVGDLTVKGVTHPTTWRVTARNEGNNIVGTAATMFTFKDFSLDQPRVPVVLSVEDTIKLEYDFRFAPDTIR
jgi:polyisoprenoid-binding protein YceI